MGNRNRAGNGRRDRTGERRTKGDQRKAEEGDEHGGQTGNRRKARRGNRRTCGEAPDRPVRVRGFGAARIYDAAGRVLAGLRGLRIVVRQLSGGQRLSVSRAPRTLHSPGAPACALRSVDRRPQRARQSSLLAYPFVRRGVGSLAVHDAGRPDRGVLHARGAGGVHGDRPGIHVGGGWGASRSRAGFDERTRLRFSRISIARCAGLVPLLRVCLGPSRHGQCTVPWELAPWTNVPARGTFGPAAQLLLAG